jgi:hypothetical protein
LNPSERLGTLGNTKSRLARKTFAFSSRFGNAESPPATR